MCIALLPVMRSLYRFLSILSGSAIPKSSRITSAAGRTLQWQQTSWAGRPDMFSAARERFSRSYFSTFYARLFGVVLKGWRRFSQRKKTSLVLAACVFSFEQHGIKDEELDKTYELLEEVGSAGADCEPPVTNNQAQDSCASLIDSANRSTEQDWQLVLEDDQFKLWKRPVAGHPYVCEYKCVGTHCDISAESFFRVQLDLQYRQEWDQQMLDFDVIQTDDVSKSEIIRWVTNFPYPLTPREYVFVRRACVDRCQKIMVVVCRSIDSDTAAELVESFPPPTSTRSAVRVERYNMRMLIRPHEHFEKPGFDYVMVYSDDPKAPFPGAVYRWMVKYGVPGFLRSLHNAAKQLYNGGESALIAV